LTLKSDQVYLQFLTGVTCQGQVAQQNKDWFWKDWFWIEIKDGAGTKI
jgi:hypothetical protein